MRTLMLTITLTGLRPSEALGLKRHEIGGDELEITGKGSKKRTIYFIPELLSAIRYLLSTHSDSRVFPIPLRTAEYRFQGYRKRAKLTRHVVLHDLRHTYATNLLLSEKRVPAELIAVLLGHSDVKVTRKYYLAVRQKDAKAMHFQALSKQPETKFANSERRFLV
jgi:integrase